MKKLQIGLAVAAVVTISMLILYIFITTSLSLKVTQAEAPLTLSQRLTEVYIEKTSLRLQKSDLLVRLAGLSAQTQKAEADIRVVNTQLLALNQVEIDISQEAVVGLQQ